MPVASLQNVAMETYAIDYTLSQTDRAPIKADFLALQKITEEFLKDHMVNAYKVSTQANLVDFKTSFVTAYFTYVYLHAPSIHKNVLEEIFKIDIFLFLSFLSLSLLQS